MVMAVACGLVASFMTSRYLAGQTKPAAVEEEKVTILVARQSIPMATLLKEPEKYFVEKAYTAGEEPKKAIRTFDQLKDRRLIKPLTEEQWVTTEDLRDSKEGLEGVLPQGMRAIALKVSPESIVGGLVLPHSRVDVIATVKQGDQTYSHVILQNMLVLASDMTTHRDPDKQGMLANTVTLAARPEDAEKLRLAGAIGELSLMLRGANDDKFIVLKPATAGDMLKTRDAGIPRPGNEDETLGSGLGSIGLPDIPSAPNRAAKTAEKQVDPTSPRTFTQTIYNGDEVTKTTFLEGPNGWVTNRVEKSRLSAVVAGTEENASTESKAASGTNKGQPEVEHNKEAESAPKVIKP
jgi:pilus assembly protein CpaB